MTFEDAKQIMTLTIEEKEYLQFKRNTYPKGVKNWTKRSEDVDINKKVNIDL